MAQVSDVKPRALTEKIGEYEVYKQIGYGGNGTISFGLHSKDADNIRSSVDHKVAIQGVRDKIVAIKKPYDFGPAREAALAEIRALKKIKDLTQEGKEGENFYHNFAQYLDSAESVDAENNVKKVEYICMAGIAGINLFNYHLEYQHKQRASPSADLEKQKEPSTVQKPRIRENAIPAPFVFRVFLEIGAALEFMHNDLEMAHGDVKAANIIIREKKPHGLGLPEIALIDYGSSCHESEVRPPGDKPLRNPVFEQKINNDRIQFYQTIYGLVSVHRGCGISKCVKHQSPAACPADKEGCDLQFLGCNGDHPKEWAAFETELEHGIRSGNPDLGNFLTRFEGVAERIANDLKPTEEYNLGAVLDLLVQKELSSEGISNAELGHGIERMRKR